MKSEDPTKWYLNLVASTKPGGTEFPMREPYDSESEARAACITQVAEARGRGGKVGWAYIDPPNGGKRIVLIRRKTV